MIQEVSSLIEEYTRWLKDKTVLREVGDWIEITTPFLDRHNDYIQIYARRDNGGFMLTDDSYTIEDLISSGVKLESVSRKLCKFGRDDPAPTKLHNFRYAAPHCITQLT